MNKNIIREKFEGIIIGGAIGDAMGLPVEMKTKEYIKEIFGYIDDFHETRKNIFFAKGGFDEKGVGYISDDTLLTLATLDSLSESGKVDMESMGQQHIRYHDTFPYGFGKSTKNAVEALRNGASPLVTGSPNGTGNGIMMKQAPLAMYYAVSLIPEEQMIKEIIDYSCMTHANKISVVSAIVHNKMLLNLILSDGYLDKKNLIEELYLLALKFEKDIRNLESNGENISDKLKEIHDLIDSDGNFIISDDELLDRFGWGGEKIYKSCYIGVTLPIIYSLFLRNPDIKGFLDSINIGGDTDSNGAIMGNMVGAYLGRFYPERYERQLQDEGNIKERINCFSECFLKS